MSGMLVTRFSRLPASMSNTFQSARSLSRLANTQPAGPEPTMMKSYSVWAGGELPEINLKLELLFFNCIVFYDCLII